MGTDLALKSQSMTFGFPKSSFSHVYCLKKDTNVLILSDLDPILKSYSNITKVIDDSVRCYKEEALEKSTNCKTKRNLEFFSLKLF